MIARLRMCSVTWNLFPIKNISLWIPTFHLVEISYLNTDKYESRQNEESRAQSADSSKADSEAGALNWIAGV